MNQQLLVELEEDGVKLNEAYHKLRVAGDEFEVAAIRFTSMRDIISKRLGESPFSILRQRQEDHGAAPSVLKPIATLMEVHSFDGLIIKMLTAPRISEQIIR